MAQTEQLVMLRAKLTPQEYADVKVAAIRAGKSTADFLGELIRDFLNGRTNG